MHDRNSGPQADDILHDRAGRAVKAVRESIAVRRDEVCEPDRDLLIGDTRLRRVGCLRMRRHESAEPLSAWIGRTVADGHFPVEPDGGPRRAQLEALPARRRGTALIDNDEAVEARRDPQEPDGDQRQQQRDRQTRDGTGRRPGVAAHRIEDQRDSEQECRCRKNRQCDAQFQCQACQVGPSNDASHEERHAGEHRPNLRRAQTPPPCAFWRDRVHPSRVGTGHGARPPLDEVERDQRLRCVQSFDIQHREIKRADRAAPASD